MDTFLLNEQEKVGHSRKPLEQRCRRGGLSRRFRATLIGPSQGYTIQEAALVGAIGMPTNTCDHGKKNLQDFPIKIY